MYLSAQALMYGSGRSELMQVYVQKSTSTTFPRSDLPVRGGVEPAERAAELGHASLVGQGAGRSALPSAPSAATVTPIAGRMDAVR